ncbi:hypothetical protein D9757_013339 [Collybiopsis confluens]|uniref:Uncharacterized protein n=1 Tax=Collybiopsis confluens TaxID=2823264 RepID=A0A8H5D8B3_9AGAR|nr:hypothetical protein D9757_013339 [Collybiopsis confluens]
MNAVKTPTPEEMKEYQRGQKVRNFTKALSNNSEGQMEESVNIAKDCLKFLSKSTTALAPSHTLVMTTPPSHTPVNNPVFSRVQPRRP